MTRLITNAVVLVIALAFAWGLWTVRRARARSTLKEVDEGRRCIACESTEVDVDGGIVRCRRCGHAIQLSFLQGAKVSEREIDDLTKPDQLKGD
jgi:hypothetical protein